MAFELGENAKMALSTLRENKMRSFLTVLGVVIGITALVTVVALMAGFRRDLQTNLDDYGTDVFWIFKFEPGFRGQLTQEERQRKPLSYEDAMAILEQVPAVKSIAVDVFPRITSFQPLVTNIKYQGNEVLDAQFSGTLPTWPDVYNGKFTQGRFFTEGENLSRSQVVVIGYDAWDGLFKGASAIGKEILINGTPFEVVGVLDKRAGQFFRDPQADKVVVIPYRTYQKMYPTHDEHFLGVKVYPERKAEAEDEIRALLRRRRGVAFSAPDNFGLTSAEQMGQQFNDIMGSVALVIAAMASVGLLVGGVGVMNIMLMSVTQRTREIGVRKAIGAKRRDIIWQFLTEAMTLTGVGGLIGVGLALLVSFLISFVFPAYVPMWAMVLAVGVSMSVGIVFGMYPALKASKLDPVEALRYE